MIDKLVCVCVCVCVVGRWKDVFTAETSLCEKSISALVHVMSVLATMCVCVCVCVCGWLTDLFTVADPLLMACTNTNTHTHTHTLVLSVLSSDWQKVIADLVEQVSTFCYFKAPV